MSSTSTQMDRVVEPNSLNVTCVGTSLGESCLSVASDLTPEPKCGRVRPQPRASIVDGADTDVVSTIDEARQVDAGRGRPPRPLSRNVDDIPPSSSVTICVESV